MGCSCRKEQSNLERGSGPAWAVAGTGRGWGRVNQLGYDVLWSGDPACGGLNGPGVCMDGCVVMVMGLSLVRLLPAPYYPSITR